MPKVLYTTAKGLHQVTGTGVELTGDTTLTGATTITGAASVSGILSGNKRAIIRTSTSATPALTEAQSGALVIMDNTATTTITLPMVTAAAIGTYYDFQVTTASDNLRKVVTKFNNDYIVGGVTHGFDGADNGAVAFVSSVVGDTHVAVQVDDNLGNCGSGNAYFRLTAILTGNTAGGGGSKAVWSINGNFGAVANNGTGAAIFA
jgi:hypothetical protein